MIEHAGTPHPVEIKLAQTVAPELAAGLRWWCRHTSVATDRATLLYGGHDRQRRDGIALRPCTTPGSLSVRQCQLAPTVSPMSDVGRFVVTSTGPSHAERRLNPVCGRTAVMAGPCQIAASGCVGRSLYDMSKYEPLPPTRNADLRRCVAATSPPGCRILQSAKKKCAGHLTGLALLVTARCRTFRPLRPFEHPVTPSRPASTRQRRPAPFPAPVPGLAVTGHFSSMIIFTPCLP